MRYVIYIPTFRNQCHFPIYVYNSNGSLKSVAANIIGANYDNSIIRGSGDYYLTINTAQPYEVNVESLN